MTAKKGFTMIEMIVVLVIVGLFAALAVPNFLSSIRQTEMQAVENNLRSIVVKEQRFYEDNNKYYVSPTTGTCLAIFNSINQDLSLSMSTDTVTDGFVYSCLSSGTCSATCLATCSASCSSIPPSQPNQVSIDSNGNVTCSNNAVPLSCP